MFHSPRRSGWHEYWNAASQQLLRDQSASGTGRCIWVPQRQHRVLYRHGFGHCRRIPSQLPADFPALRRQPGRQELNSIRRLDLWAVAHGLADESCNISPATTSDRQADQSLRQESLSNIFKRNSGECNDDKNYAGACLPVPPWRPWQQPCRHLSGLRRHPGLAGRGQQINPGAMGKWNDTDSRLVAEEMVMARKPSRRAASPAPAANAVDRPIRRQKWSSSGHSCVARYRAG